MAPNRSDLARILRRCGIALEDRGLDQLWAYHGMLRRANARLNLTRIHNFENMVLKHYVDSLLVLRYEELPSPLLDMGSGPGLPGIPLKIARPELRMILAEPRQNRARFLEETCRELGLEEIEVYAGKVGAKFPHRVRGVITRAVATIPETLERVVGALVPAGRMYFMKGPECDEEIEEARAHHGAAFQLVGDHAYVLPHSPHRRRLVVYERTSEGGRVEHEGGTVTITSEGNGQFRAFRELLTGKGARKHGKALVAGTRIVREALERHRERIEGWLTDLTGPPPAASGLTWYRLAPALFRELDVAGTHAPLLVARVPDLPEWSVLAPWPEGCTLFVPFQAPENVGAVIRSAAAFGVSRIVLLREAAHPFHPKSIRAAGPAVFQVTMERGPSLSELGALGTGGPVPIFGLAADGAALDTVEWPATFGLVAGLEGPGLPEQFESGRRISVPIAPAVESLNAATAVAISLYAWSRAVRGACQG